MSVFISSVVRSGRCAVAAAIGIVATACGSDTTAPIASGFLGGTSSNHQVGIVVNSTGKSVTLFQLGAPASTEQIALGTSSTITPTGLAVRGRRAIVPLGNAASVAFINLESASVQRFFTFASGNATGQAFVDDTTMLVTNPTLNVVGRMTAGQASDAITTTAKLPAQPTAVVVSGTRAVVVSANLDLNFRPIGNSIATIIDPKTLGTLGTVTLGGTNSTDAAVGPDGLVYVVNTGDYVSQGSLTIVNPATAQLVATIPNMGVGPGAISIDANGLAYVSGFFTGTLVWDTQTRSFVRGTDNPVCAKAAGTCRGAFGATTDASGNVYQLFFGDPTHNLAPYTFVFRAGTFALTDSIAVGPGPSGIAIRPF